MRSTGGPSGARLVVPTLVLAAVSSAVAVAVNLATEWKTSMWAWGAVLVVTMLSAVVSLWLSSRSNANSGATSGNKVVQSSIRAGGSVVGISGASSSNDQVQQQKIIAERDVIGKRAPSDLT